jgi:hypothetical protein
MRRSRKSYVQSVDKVDRIDRLFAKILEPTYTPSLCLRTDRCEYHHTSQLNMALRLPHGNCCLRSISFRQSTINVSKERAYEMSSF